jgi:hypothetical protein
MALLVAAMHPAQAQRSELRHRCVEGSAGENFGTDPDFGPWEFPCFLLDTLRQSQMAVGNTLKLFFFGKASN